MGGAKRIIALGLVALCPTVAASGCSSSSTEEGVAAQSKPTAYANVDLANTRNAASSLEANTVSGLKQVWSRPLDARSEGLHFIGSPAVDEGIAFLQDPESNVEAIDLASGELLWEKLYRSPAVGSFGVMAAEGLVFGATPSSAFALDAGTGEEVWSVKLADSSSVTINTTPGYHNGLVYFGTSPNEKPGGVGTLWALDADSGKKVWHFDNVPRGLWGHPEINYGGGVFYAPAFDGQGSVYVGIGHAGPIPGTEEHPWGSSRPGPNLYSQSIVKLDERTGEVQWHYQITPHGLCGGYLVSPVLAKARGRDVVLGVGALGVLVAVDRKSGELLWRQPVGKHNGHDNDGLMAMRGEYDDLDLPMTVYPGTYGGVAAPISVRGSTAFVPVVNGATRLLSQTEVKEMSAPKGELVAVDIGTGAIRWKRQFPTSAFGPTTTTNDLVFATAYEGMVAAFDAETGRPVWKEKLPIATEGGMAIFDDTLLVRAGSPFAEEPKLMAYRLDG